MNYATYVAGKLADGAQLPTNNISATYNGFIVGAVDANGRQYIHAGSYSNNWNFQDRRGQVTAVFDSRTFTGQTAQSALGNVNFSASIASGDRTLALNGAFFGSNSTSGPQGQAGSFKITGPATGGDAYKAAGIFAAQK
jgi:hypothetical protein